MAALRKRQFFSLAQVNEAVGELIAKLNQRPFRKLPGSRLELYETWTGPLCSSYAQHPMRSPSGRRIASSSTITWSSRPLLLRALPTGEQRVEIRYTDETVEMLYRGKRVASHARSIKARDTTDTRPSTEGASAVPGVDAHPHAGMGGRPGPFTARLVKAMLTHKPHPEAGYRSAWA